MKTKERKVYHAPQCQIAQMSEETSLMVASFPSQHNPAQPGGSFGDAKQVPNWMTESEEETEHSSWED